jgi:hypothetical protein
LRDLPLLTTSRVEKNLAADHAIVNQSNATGLRIGAHSACSADVMPPSVSPLLKRRTKNAQKTPTTFLSR